MIGDKCLKEGHYLYAARAYELAGDREKLTKVGDIFLKSGLLSNALQIYELANNKVMVQFIKQNFAEKDYSNKIYI